MGSFQLLGLWCLGVTGNEAGASFRECAGFGVRPARCEPRPRPRLLRCGRSRGSYRHRRDCVPAISSRLTASIDDERLAAPTCGKTSRFPTSHGGDEGSEAGTTTPDERLRFSVVGATAVGRHRKISAPTYRGICRAQVHEIARASLQTSIPRSARYVKPLLTTDGPGGQRLRITSCRAPVLGNAGVALICMIIPHGRVDS